MIIISIIQRYNIYCIYRILFILNNKFRYFFWIPAWCQNVELPITLYDPRITLDKSVLPPLASSFLSLLPFGGGMKNIGKEGCYLFLISQPLWNCHYRDSFVVCFSVFSISTSLHQIWRSSEFQRSVWRKWMQRERIHRKRSGDM